MNGEILGRVIGVFQIVQYYTEPLVTPIGETKGWKVLKLVMKTCVNDLN